MAHNIHFDEKTGTHSFVSSKNQVAWHKLGQVLPDALLTSEQCIQHANLGFEVEKRFIAYNEANYAGKQRFEINDYFATVRTDTNQFLGIVGKKYNVVQNLEAFAFFDSIVGEGKAIYETAGVLGNGEVIFLTAALPDYVRIEGTDDTTKIYVVLKSSHDGSGSIKAMITPVRVVCQNTLNAAILQAKNAVSIRHTSSANYRLKEAHKLLGISKNYVEGLDQAFNRLHRVKISDSAYQDLLIRLFPSSTEQDSKRVKNIRAAVGSPKVR